MRSTWHLCESVLDVCLLVISHLLSGLGVALIDTIRTRGQVGVH